MALVNAGVEVNINSGQVPSGYTLPTVSTFADQEYKRTSEVITIAKTDIENANEVTAFTALVAAINVAAAALITADYDTVGLTVTMYTDWKSFITNQTVGSALYTDTAESYLCTIDAYIKTAAL